METEREKKARLFLELGGSLGGIRRLISYFTLYYPLEYKTPITGEEALKLVEDIDENSFELDFDEDDIDIDLSYTFFNAVEKEERILLDMYVDYLEDKIREE